VSRASSVREFIAFLSRKRYERAFGGQMDRAAFVFVESISLDVTSNVSSRASRRTPSRSDHRAGSRIRRKSRRSAFEDARSFIARWVRARASFPSIAKNCRLLRSRFTLARGPRYLDISIRVYTSPAIRLIKRRGARKFLRGVVQHRETLFPFYVPSVSRYPTTCTPHARG